jgi:drug/metabolite transporter (DMT)-like permease
VSTLALGLGLLSAIVYGAADVAGGVATRRSAVMTVVAGSYVVSQPALLVGALLEAGGVPSPGQVALALVGGTAEVVAIASLYLALAGGTMCLVSPLVAVVGAGIPLAVGVALGEPVAMSQTLGMTLAFAAILVVARPRRDARLSRRTTGLAIAAGLAYACSFIAFAAAQREPGAAGPWGMALMARIVGLVVAIVAARRLGHPLVAGIAARPWIVLAGVLDGVAMALLMAAYGAGPLGLTTVVVSLYPAVTLVLAALVLRERISRAETSGVAFALGAIVLMGAASG